LQGAARALDCEMSRESSWVKLNRRDAAMALVEVTEQEKNMLEAGREYADALAVLRGKAVFGLSGGE